MLDLWALVNTQEKIEEAKRAHSSTASHTLAHVSDILPEISTVKEVCGHWRLLTRGTQRIATDVRMPNRSKH
jgi:iron-sulfur cluster repair protein YtfE (RIC family)